MSKGHTQRADLLFVFLKRLASSYGDQSHMTAFSMQLFLIKLLIMLSHVLLLDGSNYRTKSGKPTKKKKKITQQEKGETPQEESVEREDISPLQQPPQDSLDHPPPPPASPEEEEPPLVSRARLNGGCLQRKKLLPTPASIYFLWVGKGGGGTFPLAPLPRSSQVVTTEIILFVIFFSP